MVTLKGEGRRALGLSDHQNVVNADKGEGVTIWVSLLKGREGETETVRERERGLGGEEFVCRGTCEVAPRRGPNI